MSQDNSGSSGANGGIDYEKLAETVASATVEAVQATQDNAGDSDDKSESSGDICGAETASGEPCQITGNCPHHDSDEGTTSNESTVDPLQVGQLEVGNLHETLQETPTDRLEATEEMLEDSDRVRWMPEDNPLIERIAIGIIRYQTDEGESNTPGFRKEFGMCSRCLETRTKVYGCNGYDSNRCKDHEGE